MNRRNRLVWILMVVAGVALIVAGGLKERGASTQAERARAIGQTVRCPVCGGETVADSKVAVAVAIRELIVTELAGGRTEAQVRTAVEEKYPGTQLVPPTTGVGSLVWILPVVALGAGGTALALAFRRWRIPEDDHDDELVA
jgi:cytochrome c-type biogenesis protein CcmH